MFQTRGFQIEIQTNLHEVSFLDITFSLRSRTYRPYKKPNGNLLYVHTLPHSSNHHAAPTFHQREILQQLCQ